MPFVSTVIHSSTQGFVPLAGGDPDSVVSELEELEENVWGGCGTHFLGSSNDVCAPSCSLPAASSPRCIHSLHSSCAKGPTLQVLNNKKSWHTCVEKDELLRTSKNYCWDEVKEKLGTKSCIHLGVGSPCADIQEQVPRLLYSSGSGPIVRGDARTWSPRSHETHGWVKSSTSDFRLRRWSPRPIEILQSWVSTVVIKMGVPAVEEIEPSIHLSNFITPPNKCKSFPLISVAD